MNHQPMWFSLIKIGFVGLVLAEVNAADHLNDVVAEAARLRLQGRATEARDTLVRRIGLPKTNTIGVIELTMKERSYYEASKLLGSLELQLGRTNAALEIYKGAAQAKAKWNINDGELYNRLGWAFYLNGDLKNSKSNFISAIETQEYIDEATRLKARNNLGLVYFADEELDASIGIFSETTSNHFDSFAQESLKQIKLYKQFKASLAGEGKQVSPKR